MEFVKRAFRGFFEVILWVNLVICAIGGAVIGYLASSWTGGGGGGGGGFLGFVLGIGVGLLSNIIGGGLIATFIEMADDIAQLRNKIGNATAGFSASRYDTTPLGQQFSQQAPRASNAGETWFCKKCNEENPLTASHCKGCGEYR